MEGEQFSLSLPPSHSSCFNFLAAVLHPDRRHGTPFSSGWKIVYILRPPTLRTSEPRHSPLGAPRGAQATSPLRRLLEVRDTSGFLSSELLQVADIVHAGRDVQPFPPTSVFPALAFTASLVHVSMHEDAVSSPLLQPDACPSRVSIYLDMSHSATSVGLPPYLEGPAGSVTLDSSYDPVWLHTAICWAPPVPPPPFRRGSS